MFELAIAPSPVDIAIGLVQCALALLVADIGWRISTRIDVRTGATIAAAGMLFGGLQPFLNVSPATAESVGRYAITVGLVVAGLGYSRRTRDAT